MHSLSQYANEQYAMVQGSRNVLFEYCRTISPGHFTDQNTSFGRGGNIRNLLVHIANTYEFWIAKNALKKEFAFAEYEAYKNIDHVVRLFEAVDRFMNEFIQCMNGNKIEYELNGGKVAAMPLKLFSHVITHEYHHKGQILSLSRHLGYIPVDTDIMR